MIYDQASGLVTRPPDPDLQARVALLERLGLGEPDPEFDAFASELAEAVGEVCGMVNLVTDRQYFIGLHFPEGGDFPPVGRTMSLDEGYCPEVVSRRRALPLPDVCASPRFAGNRVFDVLHVRTYTGVPLIHAPTGLVIGSLCVVGPKARPMSEAQERLDQVKGSGEVLMKRVMRRAGD
jgi:GAF domain-containing protein